MAAKKKRKGRKKKGKSKKRRIRGVSGRFQKKKAKKKSGKIPLNILIRREKELSALIKKRKMQRPMGFGIRG